jgi:hypothetical protein
MRLRHWVSVVLFISSYSPLALILLIGDFDPQTKSLKNPAISLSILFVSFLSVLLLFVVMRQIRQGDTIKITSVCNQSGELVNYTIPYMISFFRFDLGGIQSFSCFLLFMVLMCVLTIRTQNIFINPILALAGYGLYDVEFTRGQEDFHAILLSQHKLHRNQECRVRQLADFLYCVTDPKPKV